MSHIDDLIEQAESIIANPGQARFEPILLLELLVEIARNTRHTYDETRPAKYETPTEAYDRGSADQLKEFNRERARRARGQEGQPAESDEDLSRSGAGPVDSAAVPGAGPGHPGFGDSGHGRVG